MIGNRQTRRIDRRTALKTLGGLAIGGSGLAAASDPAAATEQGFVGVGANAFDTDGGGVDLRMVAARDPAGGGVVTHATSNGMRTRDYATSVVSAGGVALGDLTEFSYEYYGGEQNRESAPDEVWLLLEDADGTRHAVFRHASGGSPNAQQWRTRNVLAEVRGGSSGWSRLLNRGVTGFDVRSLGASPLQLFGTDARLHRVGIGRGRTAGNGTVADTYYRNLRLNGSRRAKFPTSGGSPSDGGSSDGGPPSDSASSAADESSSSGSSADESSSGGSADGESSSGGSAGGGERLPKQVVVSSPGVDRQMNYVFEVTGAVENLEPAGEDTGSAVDEIVDVDGRTRVEGTVSYSTDRFAFSGDLVEIAVPPEVRLEITDR